MKVRGGGTIDLGKERLELDFRPSARKGQGINVGRLAHIVRLGGTLSNPQPVADPKGVFESGATIGAAVATSGISLIVQSLFDRLRGSATSCGKIFALGGDRPGKTSAPAMGVGVDG